MVIKLKEYGKYVIGVGIRESASDLLIQNCDEYYSYNDLAGLTKEVDTPSTQRDPWELAAEAVAQMARNGDVMRSDRLKQVMQQIDSNFDERNAGFNRFSKFVIEAGQKGIVQLTKLDNGQYEVGPGSVAPPIAAAATPTGRTGLPPRLAATRPPRVVQGVGRKGPARRTGTAGTRRTRAYWCPGRRGRTAVARLREGGQRRPNARFGKSVAMRALTLARAFQLMSQALSEFRSPVGQEALRLRMVAMNGREDPLLDAARFQRLLRQANDAEVADVRKVGDDDYEIALQRSSSRPQLPPPPREEVHGGACGWRRGSAAEPVSPATRENGQRLGLRFRRGSRGPMRAGEIPLVGMVSIEPFAEPELLAPAHRAGISRKLKRRPRPSRSGGPRRAGSGSRRHQHNRVRPKSTRARRRRLPNDREPAPGRNRNDPANDGQPRCPSLFSGARPRSWPRSCSVWWWCLR